MAEMTAEIGLLHWGVFREAVRELQWRGHKLDMFEGSGWLERRFIVRGDEEPVRLLHRWLEGERQRLGAARLRDGP